MPDRHIIKPRRIAVLAAVILAALLTGIKIYTINRSVTPVQTSHYNQGIFVPLGEDYFWQEREKSPGYEVRVDSAQLKTYKEFVEDYGESEEYIEEDYRPEYVIDLEITVKNTNTEESDGAKGIDLIQMRVQTINDTFQTHGELFALVRPDLNGQLGFRVRPGTEMSIHLPFTRSYVMDGYESYEKFMSKQYYLLLSMYPVKKMIMLDLQGLQ